MGGRRIFILPVFHPSNLPFTENQGRFPCLWNHQSSPLFSVNLYQSYLSSLPFVAAFRYCFYRFLYRRRKFGLKRPQGFDTLTRGNPSSSHRLERAPESVTPFCFIGHTHPCVRLEEYWDESSILYSITGCYLLYCRV